MFTEKDPWTLFVVEELKLVVAGLNSTMAESHQEKDHYGLLRDRQIDWFAEKLEPYKNAGWLRIGAVHHNVERGATADDESLRDMDTLKRRLASYLNCLLHGHTHQAKTAWLGKATPILSTGSAAINEKGRPPEIPNQYQLTRIMRRGWRV
jgi:3',5'-cyclic AMP phosphodiesterase CpdA